MTKAHESTNNQPMNNCVSNRETRLLTSPLFLLQWLRTRLFELAILVWSLPFGLSILSFFQIHRSPVHVRWVVRFWSKGFIWAARWIVGVRFTIEGQENVPEHPAIFVGNHQSYWESIAFCAMIPNLNVITKAQSMDIPVFGWGLRHAPMIPVNREHRGSNIRRIIRDSRKSLVAGRSILIFPEGGRVKPSHSRAYERSFGLLYAKCNVALVPFAHNAGQYWTEGFATKTPGMITLRFYPPVAPGMDPNTVADRIESLLNREKDALMDRALHEP